MSRTVSDGLAPEDPSHVWTILAGKLEAFLAAWESATAPPAIADFVPAEPPTLRRLTLIELIKADLEARLQYAHTSRSLDSYFREFPELLVDLPLDLVYEEFQVRKQAGLKPDVNDYLARYPRHAVELQRLLDWQHAGKVSTSMFDSRQAQVAIKYAPGDQIDDFDLLARLGQGAFATVFLARQNSMQRLVALKISANRGAEPQTLAQLDNDHIVRIFDQRIVANQGLRLMYMQYIAGGTLQDVVAEVRRTPAAERTGEILFRAIDKVLVNRGESRPAEAPLRERFTDVPWSEVACWIVARLARGLDYAHRLGVLHRDIKPANVLMTADGAPKLADFNISFSSKLDGATPAAYFGGSLVYMSPEQLEANNPSHPRTADSLDGRSDLYSLGVLLWELLTGQRPFGEERLTAGWSTTLNAMTAERLAGLDPEQLAQAAQRWPAGLDQVLIRVLNPDVSQRYATGEELARHLELCRMPEARQILWPAKTSWRLLGRRHVILGVILLAIAPNLVAAVFNYSYNELEIIAHLKNSRDVFFRTQLVINSIVYTLGLVASIALSWPVARALSSAANGTQPLATLSGDSLRALRRRCLALGHYAASVSLGLWLLTAPAFPIGINLGVDHVPASVYVHFAASMTLCGLIAAAYPFFCVSCLSVCCLYPAFARLETMDQSDYVGLRSLARWSWFYLILAATVPMLSVAVLVLIGSQARYALGLLSVGGIAGLALALLLFRQLQADLAALMLVVGPASERETAGRS